MSDLDKLLKAYLEISWEYSSQFCQASEFFWHGVYHDDASAINQAQEICSPLYDKVIERYLEKLND